MEEKQSHKKEIKEMIYIDEELTVVMFPVALSNSLNFFSRGIKDEKVSAKEQKQREADLFAVLVVALACSPFDLHSGEGGTWSSTCNPCSLNTPAASLRES